MKIALCGSTKFKEQFEEANKFLTKQGNLVYTVGWFGHRDEDKPTEDEKILLDLVHLQKIIESDAIFVIDVDGYIGESTKREIMWAKLLNKNVYYWSEETLEVEIEMENNSD